MEHKALIRLSKILKSLKLNKESSEVLDLLIIKEANSVGNIVRVLGYPLEIAKAIQEIFGKNSFLIAKWIKESNVRNNKYEEANDWLDRLGREARFTGGQEGSVISALKGLQIAAEGPDELKEYLEVNGFNKDSVQSEQDVKMWADYFKEQIKDEIKSDIMFYTTFGEDIISGKITNLAPYKKMNYEDAAKKYDENRAFNEREPIVAYNDGHRWINVGKKSRLIKDHLGNCGSAGVMSMDEDRTMIGLFDSNDMAVAVVTWSPNQNRVSGVEGRNYKAADERYHEYIIDLVKNLGAELETHNAKSNQLSLRYLLMDIANNIQLVYKDLYNTIMKFEDDSGNEYYCTKYYVQDKIETDKVVDTLLNLTSEEKSIIYMPQDEDRARIISWVFSSAFEDYFKGWKPSKTPIRTFIKDKSN